MRKRSVLFLTFLSLVVMGCHNQGGKTTQNDVKKAEAALFNEDQTVNAEAVTDVVAAYTKYVEENPDAVDAPEMLFKAIDVSVNTKQDSKQCIALVDKLVADYPEFDKNPVALFMLASFVYDEQLHNLDKARETYQMIVDTYPNSPFAKDAEISITQLGMTPEELVKMFEAQGNEE